MAHAIKGQTEWFAELERGGPPFEPSLRRNDAGGRDRKKIPAGHSVQNTSGRMS